MSRDATSYRRRTIRLLSFAFAVVLAAPGCRHVQRQEEDHSFTDHGKPAKYDPEVTVPTLPHDGKMGVLPARLDSYLTQPADFLQFVHSRRFIGWERPRKCNSDSQGAGCGSGQTKGRLEIGAIEDADYVSSVSQGPADIVVARIHNVGKKVTDTRYPECVPDAALRTECFLVLSPHSGDKKFDIRLAVLTSEAKDHSSSPKLTLPRTVGVLRSCGHLNQRVPTSADFKGCYENAEDDVPYRGDEGHGGNALRGRGHTSFLRRYETEEAWMSCAEGCCSA